MNHQLNWIFLVVFLFILDNNIGDEGAKQISKSLENNKTLTTLNLECTFFIHFR